MTVTELLAELRSLAQQWRWTKPLDSTDKDECADELEAVIAKAEAK